jgi:hypothetical protein
MQKGLYEAGRYAWRGTSESLSLLRSSADSFLVRTAIEVATGGSMMSVRLLIVSAWAYQQKVADRDNFRRVAKVVLYVATITQYLEHA